MIEIFYIIFSILNLQNPAGISSLKHTSFWIGRFQVLSSHVWLPHCMAQTDHSRHGGKFCWTARSRPGFGQSLNVAGKCFHAFASNRKGVVIKGREKHSWIFLEGIGFIHQGRGQKETCYLWGFLKWMFFLCGITCDMCQVQKSQCRDWQLVMHRGGQKESYSYEYTKVFFVCYLWININMCYLSASQP